MAPLRFEWDADKDAANQAKHGVSFHEAIGAFLDANRLIMADERHGAVEKRFFCIGRAGGGIMTVRFTYRRDRIRIFGAGYWRKGRTQYEKENRLH